MWNKTGSREYSAALAALGLVALAYVIASPSHPTVTAGMNLPTSTVAATVATTNVSAVLAGGATVKGTVTFDGTPATPKIVVKKGDGAVKDAAVCAAVELVSETLVVNPQSKGIANVVVYLPKAPAGYTVPAPPKTPLIFDQKNCRFFPHMLIVPVGQPVKVLSDDPVPHNTHTFPARNDGFNQAIKANDRVGIDLSYTKPERVPIEVKCDFHPWMKAYHFPIDHPFAAATNENGEFTLNDLPNGEHKFTVWHERKGYLTRDLVIKVAGGTAAPVKLSYKVSDFDPEN